MEQTLRLVHRVTLQCLLGEVAHASVAIVGVVGDTQQQVERLERELVKEFVKLILLAAFESLAELLGGDTEGNIAHVTSERHIQSASEVLHGSTEHVRGLEVREGLHASHTAVLAFTLLLDLLAAVLVGARLVVEASILLERFQMTREAEHGRALATILVLNYGQFNLADELDARLSVVLLLGKTLLRVHIHSLHGLGQGRGLRD